MNSKAETVVAAIIAVLAVVPLTLLGGWGLSKIWAWHVVPIFGLPTLTISQAISVSFSVGYLMSFAAKNADGVGDEDDSLLVQTLMTLFTGTLKGLFLIAAGWIIHLFQGGTP